MTNNDKLIFEAPNEQATMSLGAELARLLPDGSVVALCGTLGAGKTKLVQALAEAEGVAPREVMSPTFVLVHEYAGRRRLYHFDAYRLKDEYEFRDLGIDEYFAGDGVSLVEWADRVSGCLPDERLEITIIVTGPAARRFEILARGKKHSPVVDNLRRWVESPQS